MQNTMPNVLSFNIKKNKTAPAKKVNCPAISGMERVNIIRQGVSYSSIENISHKLNQPVKAMLSIIGMPQTTYNKKKSENSLLDSKNSELLISIYELINYGIEVFNNEEDKFKKWLKKPNISLNGNSPESLLDTITGIEEIKYCLNRIEYGNFA
ncbi:MAG: DUF2384 domain-containing protein [Chitinophagaceae bacterium]|jgi:putative toxin-antitoxin system antitoxin component (TIGR02293 family)|nr:DUF2384 domain-containing protein [Chitinophagaceae bacterium]